MINKIELLSPAGSVAIGRAAIDAGADAVYIGAERFGARAAAGNTIEEIADLVEYAHSFGARVYLTMNTVLFEDELEDARQMAWAAHEAGVDALIVQDMAFARMELPPIALHASTQTFNLTTDRVAFLAAAGFTRIVLERATTLEQIEAIREAVPSEIELEAFVHGAICVSYSGQCYLGHALCGRGGNRGGCAQPCRSQYNLYNDSGKLLARNKHLLSVRDLNLSDRLDDLIRAGVCSLKIEGRLKEEGYVVNNTAYYNQQLGELGVPRISVGEVACDFTPNPVKSFSRGFTTYFLDGKQSGVLAQEAKSVGEPIGRVTRVEGDAITLELRQGVEIHNGDGVCFLSCDGKLQGSSVNGVEDRGTRLILNKVVVLQPGTDVFRNLDRSFRPSAIRKIRAVISFSDSGDIVATDNTGISASLQFSRDSYSPATNRELAERNIRVAFSKGGDTIFRVERVDLPTDGDLPFIPSSELNALRRDLLARLLSARQASYNTPAEYVRPAVMPHLASGIAADYRANVANTLSKQFYREAGIEIIEKALETNPSAELIGREVMRTSYCIRREMGSCLKQHPEFKDEKLSLENNGIFLELHFDCLTCEMSVVRARAERLVCGRPSKQTPINAPLSPKG